jgi:hypothetical protein
MSFETIDEIIDELQKILGKHTIDVFVKRGVSVEGRYLVCVSYAKNPLFLNLMKKYQEQFTNDPNSKYELVHIRNGNFLLIKIDKKVTPKDFIKSFGEYALEAKLVEVSETEYGLFVIIKPFDEITEELLYTDLENCGFEIIDDTDFIIAMAKTA